MMQWKDATSYSQGDKERIPRVWEAEPNGVRVVVHRLHGCDGWFLSIDDIELCDRALDTDGDSAEAAKTEGAVVAMAHLAQAARRFEGASRQLYHWVP